MERCYYRVLKYCDNFKLKPTRCKIYARDEDDALEQLGSFLAAIGYKFPAVKEYKTGKSLVALSEKKKDSDGAEWSFDQFIVRS